MESQPITFIYKIVFILFFMLFYFKRDLNLDLANLLEVVMFGLLGLAILIDVVLWLRRMKTRIAKFRAERIGG